MAGLLELNDEALAAAVRDAVLAVVDEIRAERAAAPEYLRVAEVAELLKVHPNTVYRWIADGDLAAFKVGENTRVSFEAYREFVAANTTGDQTDALRAVV